MLYCVCITKVTMEPLRANRAPHSPTPLQGRFSFLPLQNLELISVGTPNLSSVIS